MTPKKLSESDKQEILQLYRSSPETSSTLANRYEVSTSTISRLLKASFSEVEYEALIQQKRSGRFQNDVTPASTNPSDEASEPVASESPTPDIVLTPAELETGIRRQRRRSSAVSAASDPIDPPDTQLELPTISDQAETESIHAVTEDYTAGEFLKEILKEDLVIQTELSEDEDDEDDLEEDEDLLDDLEDDLEDLDEGEEDGNDLTDFSPIQIQPQTIVQVLPLSEADIPKIFYLVVDRTAELITRPLRDFGVLGQIPAEETQEKTLPIFDNHRVARRFSRKTQRVIKVPDGTMLQKVGPYLQAKGITRLLIDGHVYSLP